MGVQSLTKFVRTKQLGLVHSIEELRGQALIMDGNSLIYALSVDLDWRFGGELAALRNLVSKLCSNLESCGISMTVFIDGSKSELKRSTLDVRQSKRLDAITHAYKKKTNDIHIDYLDSDRPDSNILPATAMSVFIDELLKNRCKVGIVQGEADGVLCSNASQVGGLVCSNDSDCLIYKSPGLIFIDDLLKVNLMDPNEILQVYTRAALAKCFGFEFSPTWMPIFAVLCGNDCTRSMIDPVISHISREIKYGYFIVKIATFIINAHGNLKKIVRNLISQGVVTEEHAKIITQGARLYTENAIPFQMLTSMRTDYLHTMFTAPARAVNSGICYLPVIPHDMRTCKFNIWSKTADIRKILYSILGCKPQILEYVPGRTQAVQIHVNQDAGMFFSKLNKKTVQTRLKEIDSWIFGSFPHAAWYRKWKRHRIFSLAIAFCGYILENNADWEKFQCRLKHIYGKGKSQPKGTDTSVSSSYYALFQVSVMHMNLLMGALDMYAHAPPFLEFKDGTSLHSQSLSDVFAPKLLVAGY